MRSKVPGKLFLFHPKLAQKLNFLLKLINPNFLVGLPSRKKNISFLKKNPKIALSSLGDIIIKNSHQISSSGDKSALAYYFRAGQDRVTGTHFRSNYLYPTPSIATSTASPSLRRLPPLSLSFSLSRFAVLDKRVRVLLALSQRVTQIQSLTKITAARWRNRR